MVKIKVLTEEMQSAAIPFAAGNDETSFEAIAAQLRTIDAAEPQTASELGFSEGKAKKPELVTLILTHLDGHQQKEVLLGARVPDLEDWEDMADRLWLRNEKSKHGRLVFVRMKDETGRPYLRKHEYSICSKRCLNRNCFSVLGCLPNDPI
jgi:hypothetical protein